jgi:hypothetical protein
MPYSAPLARYLNPWKFKREQEREQRIAELRSRDGERCRRCRRPIRFDLPAGHDQAPKIEQMVHNLDGQPADVQHLYLCHTRCNAAGVDHTPQVTERVRRKSEAELFAKSRSSAA